VETASEADLEFNALSEGGAVQMLVETFRSPRYGTGMFPELKRRSLEFSTETEMRSTKMNRNPVGWFEIYVDNLERAKKFYESVLGVALTKLEAPLPDLEMFAFPMDMQAAGASGAIMKMKGFPAGGNGTLVYFSCKDCAVEGARVEAAGGKIQKPKTSIGQYGFMILAVDTEGNMFGLHSLA
jgi:predicted enzyme related to lactoylglutathione lyase